jgi:hypothetical protein
VTSEEKNIIVVVSRPHVKCSSGRRKAVEAVSSLSVTQILSQHFFPMMEKFVDFRVWIHVSDSKAHS